MPPAAKPRKDWLFHYAELLTKWRRGGRVRPEAEDAMQDTVVGMLEGGVGAIHDPRAYMSRGMSNRLVSWHRHATALEFSSLDDMDEVEHPAAVPADDGIRFRQLVDSLEAALAELPLKCRQVYIMCRLEGLTHTEIARSMGLSRSMVEKYMTRSIRHINERMRDHAPH